MKNIYVLAAIILVLAIVCSYVDTKKSRRREPDECKSINNQFSKHSSDLEKNWRSRDKAVLQLAKTAGEDALKLIDLYKSKKCTIMASRFKSAKTSIDSKLRQVNNKLK